MTAEKLHDAIGLLPASLVAETDALRQRPQSRRVSFARWAAMAACLALMLCGGLLLRSTVFAPKYASDNTALMAPAAAEAAPAEAACQDAGAERSLATAAESTDAPHDHGPAQADAASQDTANGYCGNTSATVCAGGEAYSLWGQDAIVLTDLLLHLRYDPERVCSCPGEYTVDTEMETGYEISLTQYFVRCADGQADLTEAQAQTIGAIVAQLGIDPLS